MDTKDCKSLRINPSKLHVGLTGKKTIFSCKGCWAVEDWYVMKNLAGFCSQEPEDDLNA